MQNLDFVLKKLERELPVSPEELKSLLRELMVAELRASQEVRVAKSHYDNLKVRLEDARNLRTRTFFYSSGQVNHAWRQYKELGEWYHRLMHAIIELSDHINQLQLA